MAASIRLSAAFGKPGLSSRFSKYVGSLARCNPGAMDSSPVKSRYFSICVHKPKLPASHQQIFRSHSVRYKQRPFGQVCWNCRGPVQRTDIACPKCDSLQEGYSELNYFEVLGETPRYDLDASKLQEKLHEMQKRLHPDKFATKPRKEQDISDDLSALVNQAYQILSRPEKRARYLLELHGIDLQSIQLDAAFLDRMMELNERVADMDRDRDQEPVREHLQTVRVEISLLNEQLDAFFQKDDLEQACVVLAKLMYLRNVEALLRDVLKEL